MSFESAHASVPPPTGTDPSAPLVSFSCLDFLLIELVPMSYRLAGIAAARERDVASLAEGGESPASGSGDAEGQVVKKEGEARGVGCEKLGIGGIGGAVEGWDEEETREAVFWRLDSLGYRVGLGIVDRFARDKPRFNDTLDVIKFICKDLWTLVFKKQIDNLKTNHRGVYVLTDNSFRPLSRMSLERNREGMMAQAQPFLYFPAGLLRGALASMGVVASVQAETADLPGATFQIRTAGARS